MAGGAFGLGKPKGWSQRKAERKAASAPVADEPPLQVSRTFSTKKMRPIANGTEGAVTCETNRELLLALAEGWKEAVRVLPDAEVEQGRTQAEPVESARANVGRRSKDVLTRKNDGAHISHELLRSARKGDTEAVRSLVAAGADVMVTDLNQRTPLHFAATFCDENAASLLLGAGADAAAKDDQGNTPLHLAARRGCAKVAELLLSQGKRHWNRDCTVLLGAGVSARRNDRTTPLHLAAGKGSETVVRMLLDAGAKVAAEGHLGKTPLDWALDAAEAGGTGRHTAVVKALLEAGAKTAARYHSKGEELPLLHAAAWRGQNEVVRTLLDAEVDVGERDSKDNTALHLAAGGGYETVVGMLLDAGADAAVRNSGGKLPRNLAKKGGFLQIVKTLKEAEHPLRNMAFAMGHQERLGATSLVRGLDPELLRMVLDFV